MSKFVISLICIFQFAFISSSLSQTSSPSKNIKTINGKKYYIHKVEKGQSLYGIAKIYGVDLNALILENPDAIDGIKTGQELKIPAEVQKTQAPLTQQDYDNYIIHKVARNETIFSICRQYQVTEEDLNKLNPDLKNGLKENNTLKIKPKQLIAGTGTVSVKTGTVSTVSVAVNDTIPLILAGKPKKTGYTIGVFLPFSFTDMEALNIDELILNKENFPATQQMAIDFYQGLVRAADSLKADNFRITFKIYDVGEKDSLNLSRYTNDDPFRNLDLIIGPLYNASFRIVSGEAKKLQIPCISPLTQQNKILYDNLFTSKTTPSNTSLLSALAVFCADSFSSQNVVMINSGIAKEQSYAKIFRQAYNAQIAARGKGDTLGTSISTDGMKSVYRSDKLNYFVFLTENEVSISSFLTKVTMFAEKKENLRMVGLRKWLQYDNLDLEYFNRFGLVYACPYFIDPDNDYLKKINQVYRDQFFCDAGDYYYYGAETGLYYLNLLKNQGPSFCISLDGQKKKGSIMDFDFFHPNNNTGFENRSVRIIQYTGYKLKKIN